MKSMNRLSCFLRKKWIHLLVWITMLVFFFVSPGFIDRKNITEGRPVELPPVTLQSTDLIRYSVDRLDPYAIKGQDIFDLWGWSFVSTDETLIDYDIYIVLTSDNHEYTYKSQSIPRKDLNEAFPEVEFDLSNSGFVIYLAKEFIANGVYDIGILYHNIENGENIYQLTNKQIVKTANNLRLDQKSSDSGN